MRNISTHYGALANLTGQIICDSLICCLCYYTTSFSNAPPLSIESQYDSRSVHSNIHLHVHVCAYRVYMYIYLYIYIYLKCVFMYMHVCCSTCALSTALSTVGTAMKATALLLVLLWSLVEVHSQTAPYVSFMGETLPNHAFVNLSLVGNDGDGNDSVQCHTDLNTCCSGAQGGDRGDWYFPSGDRLQFSNKPGDIYEFRTAQQVDLRRRNNGDMPSGIYRCNIETMEVNSADSTDTTTRETVYAGIYATGGKLTLLLQLH